jgi:antagonist of KipI
MSIKVLRPGLLSSIQDLGRYGYQKHGVIVSGAMDAFSLRIGNLLVGNMENQAGLEITLVGPQLLIKDDLLIAITGGNLTPMIDGVDVPMWRPVYVKGGSVLSFGPCQSGCRAYLTVGGGYELPSIMNSDSTYLRAGIGGFCGRALQKDDQLAVGTPGRNTSKRMSLLASKAIKQSFVAPNWYAGLYGHSDAATPATVRITRGIQYDWFTAESLLQFTSQPFQVTPQSDRMGYRLKGEALKLRQPSEMISEAVALGTIQVPPDGNPIILMADRQTVGGYPKVAQVISVDVPRIAQVKPGGKIQFIEIEHREAEALYFAREKFIAEVKKGLNLKFFS